MYFRLRTQIIFASSKNELEIRHNNCNFIDIPGHSTQTIFFDWANIAHNFGGNKTYLLLFRVTFHTFKKSLYNPFYEVKLPQFTKTWEGHWALDRGLFYPLVLRKNDPFYLTLAQGFINVVLNINRYKLVLCLTLVSILISDEKYSILN